MRRTQRCDGHSLPEDERVHVPHRHGGNNPRKMGRPEGSVKTFSLELCKKSDRTKDQLGKKKKAAIFQAAFFLLRNFLSRMN